MNARGHALIALAVVLMITACTDSSRAEHTVDYYRAHAAERRARLKECTNDPGSRQHLPDCVNVFEADRLEGIGSFRHLPPMEMPPTPESTRPPR